MKHSLLKKAAMVFASIFAVSSLAGAIAVNAADETGPDLTKTDCSITIHKYIKSSTSDWPVQENTTGLEQTVNDSDAKPREGVSFVLYKVVAIDPGKPITQDDGKLTNDIEHLGVVDQSTGEVNEAALEANNLKLDSDAATNSWKGTTDEQGVYSFTGLPTGIYLVAELDTQDNTNDDTAIADPADPFIINLPTQYKDESGAYQYNYNVHVYPKNGSLSIHKDVQHIGNQDHTANIDEDETWIIYPSVPHDIARSKQYTVTDSIDPRLDYNAGQTVVVKPAGADGAPLSDTSKTLVKDTDYTVTEPTSEDKTLTIDFTEAGRKALADMGAKRVFISYTTKINNTVIEDDLGVDIPNQAQLHYTNFYGVKEEPVSEKPEVHTGAVKVTKLMAGGTVVSGTTSSDTSSEESSETSSETSSTSSDASSEESSEASSETSSTSSDASSEESSEASSETSSTSSDTSSEASSETSSEESSEAALEPVALAENTLSDGTGTPLEGAKFSIYASEDDAKTGTNPIEVTDQNGDRVTTVTTGKDGVAAFYGLAYGPKADLSEAVGTQQGKDAQDTSADNATTYYIKETQAPDGFAVMTTIVPVTIGSDGTKVIAMPLKDIYNSKFAMPLTGAEGIFPIIAAGTVVAIIAVCVGVRKSKNGRAAA